MVDIMATENRMRPEENFASGEKPIEEKETKGRLILKLNKKH